MAWGMPPSYKESKVFIGSSYTELLQKLERLLLDKGYDVTSSTAYNIQAKKKIGMTFFSAANFSRPVLSLSAMADEDSKLTIEITYGHSSYRQAAFNDLGKSKKYVSELMGLM